MKRLFILTLLLAATQVLAQDRKPIGLDDLFVFKNISQVRFSPDGEWIAFVVSETDFQENLVDTDIWVVPSAGGDALRLASSLKADNQPRWSPDGKQVAFVSSRDGKAQIYLISLEGGEATKLSDHKTGVSSILWAPDGKKIFFLAKVPKPEEGKAEKRSEPDVTVVDSEFDYTQIWAIDVESKKIEQLTSGRYNVDNFDISPDGKLVAFGARPTPKVPDFFNSDLYLMDLEERKPKKIVERAGIDTDPHFSPDGKTILFSSTDGVKDWIRNRDLCTIPAAGGKVVNLTKGFDEHASFVRWSPDGRWVYFSGNEGVATHMYRVSSRGGKAKKMTTGRFADGSFDVSPDGRRVAFKREDAEHPDELYVSSIGRFEPKKLTAVNDVAQEYRIAKSEVITWKGADGWTIEGILTKPIGYETGRRYPLIVLVHGGPAGVFTNSFTVSAGRPVQLLAAEGYAVLMPNPRGSGGYGEKFRKANLRDWGGKDYQDIMAGVDYVIRIGVADPERMGIMGWSYGGFMTSWVITQTNRFKAARVGAGVTNLYSFYGQTDIPDFMETYFASLPWTDAKVFQEHSAMYHIKNVKTPTLILHGQKDLRVPLPQDQELYTALKDLGVPTELVVYPRQGHGVREPRLQRDVAKRTVEWFNRWVLGKAHPGINSGS